MGKKGNEKKQFIEKPNQELKKYWLSHFEFNKYIWVYIVGKNGTKNQISLKWISSYISTF